MTRSDFSDSTAPGLFRRLAVIVYDALIMLAVLFLAAAVALPLTGGEAVAAENPVYQLYLLAVAYLYLGWFWTHGGQTVAMRAWRLRVLDAQGRPLGWGRAALRFGAALLPVLPVLLWLALAPQQTSSVQLSAMGLAWLGGFMWVAVDPQRRAWHDILSGTVMRQQAPPPK